MKSHPQISQLNELFNCEDHPFRKVHRMIDLFETIIKTHTAVIISDYFRQKKISDNVKGLLAEGLRVPTLGIWHFFSRQIILEMNNGTQETFIPDFINYFNAWNKKYVDKVIGFRNTYAHGATPENEDCEKTIIEFIPILDEWLNVEWLKETKIDVPICVKGKNLSSDHVFLIDENEQKLDLFPILCIKNIDKNGEQEKSLVFFNDLKKKKQVGYLDYSFSLHFRDKEIYNEFQQVIKTEEWKRKSSNQFNERIEELTEVFKGRIEERKHIKEWIQNHEKGFLFIFGKPGVGKSALIAQTFKELINTKMIELIECFIRRVNDYRHPWNLLKYLNTRLEEKYKTGIDIGTNQDEMKEKLNDRLKKISEIENRKKIVIFIDGLDEGEEDKIVKYLISETYKNMIVIYGSRKTAEVTSFYNLLPVEYKWEKHIRGLKHEDIRAMLYEVTDKYTLTKDQISSIAKKSEGNPLYMKMLCLAIEEGELKLEDGITLPKKIEDFYKLFLERYSKLSEDGDDILKSLYTFAAAKDYLTQKHLEIIQGIGPAKSERVITALQEVLHDNSIAVESEYQLFHESMREYLIKKQKSSVREAENHILNYCRKWNEYNNNLVKKYPMQYYSDHLLNLNKMDELLVLIENEDYLNEQINISNQFINSFLMYKNVLFFLNSDMDFSVLVTLFTKLIKLHNRIELSIVEILGWSNLGGIENIQKALVRLQSINDDNKRTILFFFLIFEILFNKDKLKKDYENENRVLEIILKEFDETLPKDTSLLDWKQFFPLNIGLQIYFELVNRGLKGDSIIARTTLEDSEIIALLGTDKKLNNYLDNILIFLEKDKDSKQRSFIFINVIERLAEFGYYDFSFLIINKISERFKTFALLQLYTKLMEINEFYESQYLLDKINPEHVMESFLSEFTLKLVNKGFVNIAVKTAYKITNEYYKHLALIEIIKNSKTVFDKDSLDKAVEGALKATIEIKDQEEKIQLLIGITAARRIYNGIDSAKKLFLTATEEIEKFIQNFNLSEKLDLYLSIIAELYNLGYNEKATALLSTLANDKNIRLRSLFVRIEKIEDIVTVLKCFKNKVDSYSDLCIEANEVFLKRKYFERTQFIVQEISEGPLKDRYLVTIIEALIEQREINKAKEVFNLIKDRYNADRALLNIVSHYVKQNEFEEAILYQNKINDDKNMAESLKLIFPYFVKENKLDIALSLIESLNIDLSTKLYMFLANQLYMNGDYENCWKILIEKTNNSNVDQIDINEDEKLILTKSLISSMKSFNKIDNIKNTHIKDSIISHLALSEITNGVYDKALDWIDKITNDQSRDKLYSNCISNLLENNQLSYTLNLIGKIADQKKKESIIEELITHYVLLNDFENAFKRLPEISDNSSREVIIKEILIQYCKLGNVDKAIELKKQISDDWLNHDVEEAILVGHILNGDLTKPSEFINKNKDDSWKSTAIEKIISEYFINGYIKEGFELVNTLDVRSVDSVLIKSCYSLIKTKKFNLINILLEKINDEYYKEVITVLLIINKNQSNQKKYYGNLEKIKDEYLISLVLLTLAFKFIYKPDKVQFYQIMTLTKRVALYINDPKCKKSIFEYIFLQLLLNKNDLDLTKESFENIKMDKLEKELILSLDGKKINHKSMEGSFNYKKELDYILNQKRIEQKIEINNFGFLIDILSEIQHNLPGKEFIELLEIVIKYVAVEKIELIIELLPSFNNQEIVTAGYNSILKKLSENTSYITKLIPKLLIIGFNSRDIIKKTTVFISLFLRIRGNCCSIGDTELLKQLSEMIDIDDWLQYEGNEINHSNLSEWINEIEDEDDRAQIELWARMVQKGKMTEKEFMTQLKKY